MAKNKTFKVVDHVSKLSADFRPIGAFSGPIPEPSQEALDAFRVGMSQLAAKYSFDGDPNDLAAITEYMAGLDVDDLAEQALETAQLHADLCSDEPSLDQIVELPPRYRQAFYGYLAGELAPEGSTPVGKS